jgi:predicted enzyme related to lactoylglutathione lyase
MKDAGVSVSLVKVPVSDVNQSVPYYRDVLGFEEQFTVEEYGWSSLTAGDVSLGLFVPGKGGGNATPGGSTGFQLQVDDLAALYARLHQRGALLGEGIYTSADGMQCLEIQDPDGNVLHVSQPCSEE